MRSIWPYVKWITLDWKFDGSVMCNIFAPNERVWIKNLSRMPGNFSASCIKPRLSNVNLWDYFIGREKERDRECTASHWAISKCVYNGLHASVWHVSLRDCPILQNFITQLLDITFSQYRSMVMNDLNFILCIIF